MTIIIALLVGIAIIAGIVAYWIVMATLIVIGLVLAFWAVVFAIIFGDPYVGGICSVVATGFTIWLYSLHAEKKT
jgi:hypothetical protein